MATTKSKLDELKNSLDNNNIANPITDLNNDKLDRHIKITDTDYIEPTPLTNDLVVANPNQYRNKGKITLQQMRFIVEYLTHYDAKVAAKNAGYDPKNAITLLKKEHIRKEIRKREEEIAKINAVNKHKIYLYLLDLIQDCYSDINGTDRTTILKALDMINKMQGNYINNDNNININNNIIEERKPITITIVDNNITPEQLNGN